MSQELYTALRILLVAVCLVAPLTGLIMWAILRLSSDIALEEQQRAEMVKRWNEVQDGD